MSTVLSVFLSALILAYVFEPVAEKLSAKKLPRALAALLAIGLALAVCALLIVLFFTILAREAPRIRELIPQWIANAEQWIAPLLERLNITPDWPALKARLLERASQYFSSNTDRVLGQAIDTILASGTAFISAITGLVLMVFVMFYLLVDWKRFFVHVGELFPPRQRETVHEFARQCDELLSQYLRGQLMVMAVLAAYYALALHALGMTGGLAIGLLTGIAVFVPYIGFGVGLTLALISAGLQFGPHWELLAVLAIYGIGQAVESFFLTPRLVGERIGLHPVAVVFALMFFGSLFGFFGVLLALPLSAIALVAIRFVKKHYAQSDWFKNR